MLTAFQGKKCQILAGIGGAGIVAATWQLWRKRLPPGRPLVADRPLIIGHRGCRRDAGPPENTLSAFEYALDHGADGFELDTRLTKDGVPVVFHDALIGRCLEQEGDVQVSDLTLKELQALAYRGAPTTHVATLEDALVLAKNRGKLVLVETKDFHKPAALAEEVVGLVRKHELFDIAVVISFDPRSLYFLRKMEPGIRTCLLWRPDLLAGWKSHGTELLPPLTSLCSGLIDRFLATIARTAWFPTFLGVSAIGPLAELGTEKECAAYQARGFSTYLWVVNVVDMRAAMEALARFGLWSYSTDDALFPVRDT